MQDTKKDLQKKIDVLNNKLTEYQSDAGEYSKEIEELRHTIRVQGQKLEAAESDKMDAQGEAENTVKELRSLFIEVNTLRDVLKLKRKDWGEVHYERGFPHFTIKK